MNRSSRTELWEPAGETPAGYPASRSRGCFFWVVLEREMARLSPLLPRNVHDRGDTRSAKLRLAHLFAVVARRGQPGLLGPVGRPT